MGISLSTFPPKHRGELAVFQQLTHQNDDALFLWASLDFIPGVNDIDLLLWHQNVGVFVVEIKAIPLEMLLSFSFSSCEIEGRGVHRSPQNQAYDASQSLRNYLAPKLKKSPFMVATVCWPLISRSEWKQRFRGTPEICDLADAMLMKEDIYSGSQILEAKLNDIWVKPPIRKGSDYPFRHDRDIFNEFCAALNPEAKPQAVKSDLGKLEALEKGIKRELMRTFAPFTPQKAIFHGRPGTGKTFRLQQIAIMHAREGARVLLCCFNQVLASEFKRIFNLLDISYKSLGVETSLKLNIDVLDITSLASRLCMDMGIEISTQDYDEWGQLIIDDLKSSGLLENYPAYDTVLIDESQDFKGWQLSLPMLLLNSGGTVVLGVGSGQELYEKSPNQESLVDTLKKEQYKVFNLRRNFRNARPIYELAHLVYETEFSSEKIQDVYKKHFLNKKNEQQDIEFDISDAKFPKLTYINDDVDLEFDEPEYKTKLVAKLAIEYERVISSEYSAMSDEADPSDLLILVPDTYGDEVVAVRCALDRLGIKEGIQYIDYVDKNKRKQIAPSSKIRLVTFHSSRGLEASNVIVFGAEKLASLSRTVNVNPAKLAYITLSRAIFNLNICVRSNRQNVITIFLEKALTHIQENY